MPRKKSRGTAAGGTLNLLGNNIISTGKAGGAHFDEGTRDLLWDIFPNGKCAALYGRTMMLGGARTRAGLFEDDPVNHDAPSPCITLSVIDPENGRQVPYSERGLFVMNHISEIMVLPNNFERDTAIRVPCGDGRVDSVSEVKPVGTFGGEAVIEGVIRTTALSQPAGGTQGLVAIDALGPAGENRDTQPRGDHQHRRCGGGRAEQRSRVLRFEVIAPLSHRAWLCGDQDDSTKENRAS
ncbi:MAG: phenazine antibiotic biosynthesis protein [Mycobacterium sp.]|jgi:hypothetical protein|nr:phenazine antibiotic biosynthesis protein [Mycobacterium sp.]